MPKDVGRCPCSNLHWKCEECEDVLIFWLIMLWHCKVLQSKNKKSLFGISAIFIFWRQVEWGVNSWWEQRTEWLSESFLCRQVGQDKKILWMLIFNLIQNLGKSFLCQWMDPTQAMISILCAGNIMSYCTWVVFWQHKQLKTVTHHVLSISSCLAALTAPFVPC